MVSILKQFRDGFADIFNCSGFSREKKIVETAGNKYKRKQYNALFTQAKEEGLGKPELFQDIVNIESTWDLYVRGEVIKDCSTLFKEKRFMRAGPDLLNEINENLSSLAEKRGMLAPQLESYTYYLRLPSNIGSSDGAQLGSTRISKQRWNFKKTSSPILSPTS